MDWIIKHGFALRYDLTFTTSITLNCLREELQAFMLYELNSVGHFMIFNVIDHTNSFIKLQRI